MAARLVAENEESQGLTLPFEDGTEWIIGSDPESCQLLLEDSSAEEKHLVCRTTPEGIVLENLSESDPVRVNDETVEEPLLLKNGDAVKIGESLFRFYTGDEKNVNHNEPTAASEETVIDEDAPEQDTVYEEESDEDKGILAEIDFDLRETGRWLLKVIGGPNNGAEFSMQTGSSYVIGTDPTACDVVFHDTSVSRQHARIAVSKNNALSIEDLKSRNGILVDGQPIQGQQPFEPNALITLGTTSFIVYDREGEMQTIISPLLPSIVKVLQEEDKKEEAVQKGEEEEAAKKLREELAASKEEKAQSALGAFILIGIIVGLFAVVGIGTVSLFKPATVQVKEQVDYSTLLAEAMKGFPSVRYSYNDNTGRLLLIGHVLTASDKNQLMYNLQGLEFLRAIDDSGLIIDEFVWRETNQILGRHPQFRGITVHSPTAGTFVLSGYLKTRKQAEELSDYITANFPYLDILERRVIVEEDVLTRVETNLDNAGLRNLSVQLDNGELTISGGGSKEQLAKIDRIVREFREIPGVRNVKTFINEIAPEQAMVNITSNYRVSGSSNQGGVNLNVVINGRILTRGDILDGMTITSIRPNAVFLERDGTKYRIDYNLQ
jgi:type III secretion system YscD/HrpQ family protein